MSQYTLEFKCSEKSFISASYITDILSRSLLDGKHVLVVNKMISPDRFKINPTSEKMHFDSRHKVKVNIIRKFQADLTKWRDSNFSSKKLLVVKQFYLVDL